MAHFTRSILFQKIRGNLLISSMRTTKTHLTDGDVLFYDRNPEEKFIETETQRLLKSMTRLKIDKIFHKTTVPDNSVEYKFLTTEEVEQEFLKAIEIAKRKLQMPPVVQIKHDTQRIIGMDSSLKGFSDTKFVFTDITYGIPQSKRKVVVRDTDGTLHYASMAVEKRMKQLYTPLNGRKIRKPKMFEDEHLQRCLDNREYEFVLNRLVIQYDPYEPDYHRLSVKIYKHLNDTKEFDQLRSTRHFGPMAFFYAWHKIIDDLLCDMIQKDYLRNGVELIALYYKLNEFSEDYQSVLLKLEDCSTLEDDALKELRSTFKSEINNNINDEIETAIGKRAEDFQIDDLCLQFIDNYIKRYALKKIQLELAIQTLKEINVEKRNLYKGLSKAHGIKVNGVM